MTGRVLKFTLFPLGDQEISMPEGARPLSVGYQGDQLRVWALCPSGSVRYELHRFKIRGTGHDVTAGPENGTSFLATVIDPNGYVWHVFHAGTRQTA